MAKRLLLSFACVLLTLWLGYAARRPDFGSFIAAYAAFFGICLSIVFQKKMPAGEQRWHLGLGITLRALLLFSLPNFSDDFYRFVWDGRLIINGLHPFEQLPVYFFENQIWPPGLTPELFEKLNSPRYFTVYPPLLQGVFAASASLSPGSVGGSVFFMKLLLFACEIGTIFLLCPTPGPSPWGRGVTFWPFRFFKKNRNSTPFPHGEGPGVGLAGQAALLYALNPLAIFEIVGNCHFEGAMIFFLLLGLRFLERGRWVGGAVWMACSVAVKLLPLLFLPLIFRQLGWKAGVRFLLVFALVSVLLFLPLLDFSILKNLSAGLDLYFQKFEFNASFYYLLRAAGFHLTGYNTGFWIGPALGGAVFFGVLGLAFFTIKKGAPAAALREAMLWALCLYFFCATTVHPWYATLPLALGAPTRWRFPVVWTGAAALSYSHYLGGGLEENYWFIALEYALVFSYLFFEKKWALRREKTSDAEPPTF